MIDLEECLKGAYNYESREGHGVAGLSTEFVGTVKRGNRLYDLHRDTAGNYWFEVRVITERGIVSEYEAIFGHPQRKENRRKSK